MDEAEQDQIDLAAETERLARQFFNAIDEREPRRLAATLAPHAIFRSLPHSAPIRHADQIVAYFGSVVTSYPLARWEVIDVISVGDRAAVQFVVREFSAKQGRELISEQLVVMRFAGGKIVSIVGFYDSAEFRRLFWEEA